MRDAANIQIHELIIHILDPKGQGLVLSGVDLPLKNNQSLVDYFKGHLENTLKDPSIKAARFRNINPEQPSGFCQAILNGELTLASGSQSLAGALYGIMENDMRITSGDLGVVLFSAENYPYTRFLAILKIDPAQIFRHVIREDSQGNTYVSFEPEPMAFTTEKLQKCAVIQPLDPRHPNFDMLLLDRQSRLEERAVARFFTESFLDAQEAFDSRKYTEKFVRSITDARNRMQSSLSSSDEASLESQLLQAVSSPRINCDLWVEELPLRKAIREEIDSSLRENIPDRQFSFDQTVAQRLTRKIKMRGDNGLRLEVNAENYWTVVVSEERVTDDPDRGPYYRIVIETEDWKKVV
ncbi:MAG: nucleoid-associated protein [Anaerolineales bacterium]|jgi:hypothetical protein